MFTSYDFGMTKAKSVHNTKAKAIHSAPKLEANAICEQENSMDTTVIDPTILLRQKLASRGFETFSKHQIWRKNCRILRAVTPCRHARTVTDVQMLPRVQWQPTCDEEVGGF